MSMRTDPAHDSSKHIMNSVDVSDMEQIVPMIVNDNEHIPLESAAFAHFPMQQRNDVGSQHGLIKTCWVPMKILLLLLLTPFVLLVKLLKTLFEMCKYVYLVIFNQDKIMEKSFAWFHRHSAKKMRRKPHFMVKQSYGLDLNFNRVEKHTFHRIQPTPEYLAMENLVRKATSRGESTKQIFLVAKQIKERKSVDLRKWWVQMIKNLSCGIPLKPETNCSVSRSSYRIESYWLIWPGVPKDAPVILYIHGGAFSFGNTLLLPYYYYLTKLTHLSKCRILSVNYRLTPEYTLNDGINDCEGAFNWLVKEMCVKPSQIALAGDSAGGFLSLRLMMRLKKRGYPLPKCAHLLSPVVRIPLDKEWNDSCGRYSGICVLTNLPVISVIWKLCLGEIGSDMVYKTDAKALLENPDISPFECDFEGFPPLQFLCSNWDILYDQIVEGAKKADQAGVKVELVVKEGLMHAWPILCPNTLESDMAVILAATFINKHISPI